MKKSFWGSEVFSNSGVAFGLVDLLEGLVRRDMRAGYAVSATNLTLGVTEARVEDVGCAIARLAPIDVERMGAQTDSLPDREKNSPIGTVIKQH